MAHVVQGQVIATEAEVVQGHVVGKSGGVSTSQASQLTASDAPESGQLNEDVSCVPVEVRNGFIRKVYTLLTLMLLVTTIIAAPFQVLTKEQAGANKTLLAGLLWGSLITTLIMSCCCMQMMRRYPWNYGFLLSFAVLYGVVIGATTMAYTLPSVLLAAGMTAVLFFVLTLYACVTRTDFTGVGPYLICALIGLIVFGLAMGIVSWFCASCYSTMQVVYAGLGALLFSFFIVYDTQKIVGGRHKKYTFSIDDFAFAALNLYLDIVNLFLFLLSLFGSRE